MVGWKEKVPEYDPRKAPKPLIIDYMDELEAIWGRRWGAQSGCGKLKMVMLHRPVKRTSRTKQLKIPLHSIFLKVCLI